MRSAPENIFRFHSAHSSKSLPIEGEGTLSLSVAITSAVTATNVAGSLFGLGHAANMPNYFPRQVAVPTSREIFAPILWRAGHSKLFFEAGRRIGRFHPSPSREELWRG